MTKKLLFSVTKKDFRIDTFRSGGKGGQNQNKRDTGVRLTHIDSGAVGESRTHRTQGQNRKEAFHRLLETPKWKAWHRKRTAQELGIMAGVQDDVDRMMNPKNLKIEVRKNGRWVSV